MVFGLLNHCFGIDCGQLVAATLGAMSAFVHYVLNAAARF